MGLDITTIPGYEGTFSGTESAGNQSTTTQEMVQAAPPPPAPAASSSSSSSGGSQRRNIEWAPDFSTFVDRDLYPDAVWFPGIEQLNEQAAVPAGFYGEPTWRTTQIATVGGRDLGLIQPFAIEGGFDESGHQRYSTTPNYRDMRAAGQWDFADPNSPTFDYLQGLYDRNYARFQPNMAANVWEDPSALFRALQHTEFYTGGGGPDTGSADHWRPVYEQQLREALTGLPQDYVDAFSPAAADAMYQYWQGIDDSTQFKDVASGFGEITFGTPIGMALGAYAGPGLSNYFGGGMLGAAGAGATMGAGGATLMGGDFDDILKAGVRGGIGSAAGYGGSEALGTGADAAPVQLADASGVPSETMFDFAPGGHSVAPRIGETDLFGNMLPSQPAMAVEGGMIGSSVPLDWVSPLPSFDLDAVDAQNRAELEAGDDLSVQGEAAPESSFLRDAQRYARLAKAVLDLTGSDEAPADAPQRSEGVSDEQYADELAQYLGVDLSAETLADQGLTPGTPEYYEYLMSQADAVIEQSLGGIDVDSADLAAQLRSKTADEMAQLQRALYVRGQLDMLMGSGQYANPFTGTMEDVIVGEGEQVNPHVAAFQRGVARDVEGLSGLQGQDALDRVKGMLGRNADLFGMQAAADERYNLALKEESEGDERRRRGMLPY